MRIAIVGAGISGIAFAVVLRRFGHECILFDKADGIGGIWALAYPGVRLQNSWQQYYLSDFPWPTPPDQHPTGEQILNYLRAAVRHFALDVRLQHNVVAMRETQGGWAFDIDHRGKRETVDFDYAIISIGHYAEGKHRPSFPGAADFGGAIITEREVNSLEIFRDQRVAVVGFGKSAVDMASFAAPAARSVAHVFRTPRWMIPFRLLGLHFTYPFFARATTIFMPSWIHAGRAERALHRYAAPVVTTFWKAIEAVVKRHIRSHARPRDPRASARLAQVTPEHEFASDMRSATAMAPIDYYAMVADGAIAPYHGEVKGFGRDFLELVDGRRIGADLVVLSMGSGSPVFPFLPARYRKILESEADGVQLYRHIVHPAIPKLAFAGYNHGFMHVPAAEVAALWLGAMLRGDLQLPTPATQLRTMERIQTWKRAHIQYEPSRSCAVSTRYQQYIDAMLIELGISPYRKLPNLLAECFARYGAADYAGMVDTYLAKRPALPRAVHEFDT